MAKTATIRVRDVMTPNPIGLPPSASAREAAKAMRYSDVGAVVVADGNGVCGIVTDRDIVIRALADGRDPESTKLDEICSRDPSGCSPDDGLDRAVALMRDKSVRRLLVSDGSKAVGIISLGDLAQRLDRSSVLGEISSAKPNH
ncbi:MAG: CBS domain-containing protein [Bryobacterales bacterium]|jgi:CBS domain-containing protein|nr:CBS domain-containing protein [Bryobacterales bacterium]